MTLLLLWSWPPICWHSLSRCWSFRTREEALWDNVTDRVFERDSLRLFWGINDIVHRFTNNIVCDINVVVKEVDSWPSMGSWKYIWIALDQLLLDWVGTLTFVVELLIAALKGWWGFGYIRSVGLSFLLLLLLVDIDMGEEISSEGWVTSGIVQIVQILSVNR